MPALLREHAGIFVCTHLGREGVYPGARDMIPTRGIAPNAHLVLCHVSVQPAPTFFTVLAYKRTNFRRECFQHLLRWH